MAQNANEHENTHDPEPLNTTIATRLIELDDDRHADEIIFDRGRLVYLGVPVEDAIVLYDNGVDHAEAWQGHVTPIRNRAEDLLEKGISNAEGESGDFEVSQYNPSEMDIFDGWFDNDGNVVKEKAGQNEISE
jgi:hypothetical protein